MTDAKNEWVARVPPSYSISGNVQWNRAFDERDVRSLVFRCNEELARLREERDFWQRRHSEDNEGLVFQLGCNLEFAQKAVFRSGSTEVGPTIRCIQIMEEALTAARARIAELEKARDSVLTVLDEYSCREGSGDDCFCLPCRLRAAMRGAHL